MRDRSELLRESQEGILKTCMVGIYARYYLATCIYGTHRVEKWRCVIVIHAHGQFVIGHLTLNPPPRYFSMPAMFGNRRITPWLQPLPPPPL